MRFVDFGRQRGDSTRLFGFVEQGGRMLIESGGRDAWASWEEFEQFAKMSRASLYLDRFREVCPPWVFGRAEATEDQAMTDEEVAIAELREEVRVLRESLRQLKAVAIEALYQLTPFHPFPMDGLDRTRMWLRDAIALAQKTEDGD